MPCAPYFKDMIAKTLSSISPFIAAQFAKIIKSLQELFPVARAKDLRQQVLEAQRSYNKTARDIKRAYDPPNYNHNPQNLNFSELEKDAKKAAQAKNAPAGKPIDTGGGMLKGANPTHGTSQSGSMLGSGMQNGFGNINLGKTFKI